MNTRRTSVRRVRDEVANVGANPQGNKVPPQVQVATNDQLQVNPPAMKDGEVRKALLNIDKPSPFKLKPLLHKLTWR